MTGTVIRTRRLARTRPGGRAPRRRLSGLAVVALTLAAVQASPGRVFAQSGTWTNNGSTSANGRWDSTSNWQGGVIASGVDATATFTNTTNTFAGLSADVPLGNLTTSTGRLYVTGTDNNWATQAPPSAFQLQFGRTTGTPAITNGGRVDMVVTVAGTQGFTKAGTGTLYLWAPNVYSGTTTISNGQIYLRNPDGLGAVGAGNGTVVASGATLRIDTSMTTAAEPLTISGTGYTGAGAALRPNTDGTVANYTGPITLAANATVTAVAGQSLTLSGTVDLGAHTLTLSDGGTLAISGTIGGTGSVVYNGTGSLTLSGNNTFSGTTTVSNTGGPVAMNGTLTGAMVFSPNSSGRTLIGTGTFAGGLSLGQFTVLSPGASGTAAGDSYGTITAGTLTVQSATVRLGIQDATTHDRVVMTAGSGGLTLGGSAGLSLDFAGGLPTSSLDLLSFTGLSGTFQSVTSTGFYTGTWTNTGGGVWTLADVGTGGLQTLTFTQSTGVLSAVPEPSAIALFGGGVAAAGLFRTLRRRASGDTPACPPDAARRGT